MRQLNKRSCVGLISPAYEEEIRVDGFDLRDGLFVLEIDTEAEFLKTQGFAEQEGVRQRNISGKQAAWRKPISSGKRVEGSVTNSD
jgi:hypothetical protein